MSNKGLLSGPLLVKLVHQAIGVDEMEESFGRLVEVDKEHRER